MKWAEIEEMPGYELGDDGSVRRMLRASYRETGKGYVQVRIGGKVVKRSIRRLMERYYGQDA